MYHDQGLAPLKMIGFETGVNWTLGLPFIRTSPDHGTAFDIAGRGVADGLRRSAERLGGSRRQVTALGRGRVAAGCGVGDLLRDVSRAADHLRRLRRQITARCAGRIRFVARLVTAAARGVGNLLRANGRVRQCRAGVDRGDRVGRHDRRRGVAAGGSVADGLDGSA